MKVGVVLPTTSGDAGRALAVAQTLAAGGIDGIFAADHLSARKGAGCDPFALLAGVAATVDGPMLGTLVVRAAARPAGLLAKQSAALVDASQRRFILGIGAGDAATSADDVGVARPFADVGQRRAHCAEVVAAVRALLLGQQWEGGAHVGPIAGPLLPRPVVAPDVWIGGASAEMAALGAAHGGWNGWGLDAAGFAARAAAVRAANPAATISWGGVVLFARDRDALQRALGDRDARGLPEPGWAGTTDAFLAWSHALADAGVDWLTIGVAGGDEGLALLVDDVLPRWER